MISVAQPDEGPRRDRERGDDRLRPAQHRAHAGVARARGVHRGAARHRAHRRRRRRSVRLDPRRAPRCRPRSGSRTSPGSRTRSIPFGNHVVAAVAAVASGVCDVVLVVPRRLPDGRGTRHRPCATRSAARSLPARPPAAVPGRRRSPERPPTRPGPRVTSTSTARRASSSAWSRSTTVRTRPRNPAAAMRGPMTIDDYLAARMIREPLCLFDMDVPVDGADAFVVTTTERARDLPLSGRARPRRDAGDDRPARRGSDSRASPGPASTSSSRPCGPAATSGSTTSTSTSRTTASRSSRSAGSRAPGGAAPGRPGRSSSSTGTRRRGACSSAAASR